MTKVAIAMTKRCMALEFSITALEANSSRPHREAFPKALAGGARWFQSQATIAREPHSCPPKFDGRCPVPSPRGVAAGECIGSALLHPPEDEPHAPYAPCGPSSRSLRTMLPPCPEFSLRYWKASSQLPNSANGPLVSMRMKRTSFRTPLDLDSLLNIIDSYDRS